MHFFFSWVDISENFNPTQHTKVEENIFQLKILHKEGHFPEAEMTLQNPQRRIVEKMRMPRALISVQHAGKNILIFDGTLQGIPKKIQEDLAVYSLVAKTPESISAYEKALSELKHHPCLPPLLMPLNKTPDPALLLSPHTMKPHWSRVSSEFLWSEISQAPRTLEIEDTFIKDSLGIAFRNQPLDAIDIDITAEWTQSYEGLSDIGDRVHQAFQEDKLNTLTGESLRGKWWHAGTQIAGTGYRVAESRLEKMGPEALAALSDLPKKSGAFNENDETLERCWYNMRLLLNWQYKQKRVETCRLSLKNNVHPFVKTHPHLATHRTKMHFHLNDITADNETPYWQTQALYKKEDCVLYGTERYQCQDGHTASDIFWEDEDKWAAMHQINSPLQNHGSASFFTTERGHKTIESALEIAKAKLAHSTRALHITFETAMDNILDIDLNSMVRLKDPRLPGGTLIGKVIEYQLYIDGTSGVRIARVTLGVSVAGIAEKDPPISDLPKTRSGISYLLKEGQYPKTGILYPEDITPRRLVEKVRITHTALEQNAALQAAAPLSREAAKQLLKRHQTDLRIELMDLTASDKLEHMITVEIPHPWQGPGQIIEG